MARTPIADLDADTRANVGFIDTITDGFAFSELAYQSNLTLRTPFPFNYPSPDQALLIARVTYYGQSMVFCGVGEGYDPDTHDPLYVHYGTVKTTYTRKWYKVMTSFPYTSTLYSTVTWEQTARGSPGGAHKYSEGVSCTQVIDPDDVDPPNGWNAEDLGDPPDGYQYVYGSDPTTVEYSDPTTFDALTGQSEAAEETLFEPPPTHYYWEQVCVFNYRQGLRDFLFMGGINSQAADGIVRRHVIELKLVGSRIPCTLKWKDIRVFTRPTPEGIENEEIEREISFGPGSWETTIDDGYPDEGYTVFRGTGRVIPAE